MSFLLDPHLDLTSFRIETERCLLIPLSLDAPVSIEEVWREFSRVNKNHEVAPYSPTLEDEYAHIQEMSEEIKNKQAFDCFVFEKNTMRFLGISGLNRPEEHRINIGLWIGEDEQRKGYGSEIYRSRIEWARKYTRYDFLKHSCSDTNIASQALAEQFDGVLQDEKTESGYLLYHIPLRK